MIVVETPLRLSFNGGGTDFEDFYNLNEGAVLSTTIDKSVFVIVKERFDDKIYLNWSKKEIVDKVNDIEHELIREAMKLTGVERGVEITTLSDIPSEGSGLGSSSSITVGLLHALHTYQGRLVTAEDLAQQACKIEIDILGKPIGKQDQYIAAYGGMRFITFSKVKIQVDNIKISKRTKMGLNESLLLFYVGNTRQASDILKKQKEHIRINIPLLNLKIKLAYDTRRALEVGSLDKFSQLLGTGWTLKKKLDSNTTNRAIDSMYQQAENAGASSGKIVGAGGGGFLLLYCPASKKNSVRSALSPLKELPFQFTNVGSRVIFDYRR